MNNPFIHIQEPPEQRFFALETESETSNVGMSRGVNLSFFTKGDVSVDNPTTVNEPTTTSTGKKRGRPRKESTENIVRVDDSNPDLSYTQTNVPYVKSFEETNNMLKASIYQIDALSAEVRGELENVRNSKTLKGRYTYISDLSSTASSLLTTKISAIREMNKTINDSHNLDLKRMQALKLERSQENDDMQIQALYNAYINTPISSDSFNPLAYDSKAAMMPTSMSNIVRADVMGNDDGYNNYMNNVTPEQNRMLLEGDPNIKTVVVYDQSNPNNRYFDVIDTRTGQSVPNYPRPDQLFMEDTVINPLTGLARNSNIDATWPVVVIGQTDNNLDNF